MQPERLLETFKKDLENLKDNDKYKINALTIFARDQKDSEKISLGIVELTTKHVHQIPSGMKLLGLYVIDSIVKNVGSPYRKLYTNAIVDAFVHSFQAIRDEKGRLKLYNLRTTWKDIFPSARMYELDIRVREHDPAWPLLATPPETKAAFRSLPNIPKIQPSVEQKLAPATTTSTALSPQSTISTSRDPRLNRKRKSGPAQTSPLDEFLIDRSGDQKMEAVARKHGKQEEVKESPKKVSLFGGEDLDMRPKQTSTTPTRSGVWSSYIDKHIEVGSRREVKDVDMRIVNSLSVENDATMHDAAKHASQRELLPHGLSLPIIADSPTVTERFSHSVMSENPTPHRRHFSPPELQEYHMANSNARNIEPHEEFLSQRRLPPPTFPPFPQGFRPHPSHVNFDPDTHGRFPVSPQQIQRNSHGPPIRGPVWSVEIYGFPDMVNIGVDPRMLSLVNSPKPPRRITIDGKRYSLLLDRVQPLIMVGTQVHAVRFRCELATVLINGQCFTIPGTGFTKVMIGSRPYQAYLGGPGHELVINGAPHTVPLGSQVTFINVGNHSVGVRFVGNTPRNVNVLPPIPARLLKWAGQGLFGSPRSLHLAPLNPLVELARLADGRPLSVGRNAVHQGLHPEFSHHTSADATTTDPKPPHGVRPAAAPSSTESHIIPKPAVVTSISTTVESSAAISQSINVHELFQKLVMAGIVSNSSPSKPIPPPDLANYSWERFKLECPTEIDVLYKGHQCGQCGLRFQSDSSSEFAAHLDYHYMKNSSGDQGGRSRNFYQAARYWLLSEMTHEGAPQFEAGASIPDLQESKCCAFADPAKNVCSVCYEKFDVFWDHDEEEWMLRDAVLVGDKAYHPICQEDAGKEFPTESNLTPDVQNEMKPLSDIKPEPIVSSPTEPEPQCSPGEENAFTCADPSDATQIPGLSPPETAAESPSSEDEKPLLKKDPEAFTVNKSEFVDLMPVNEQISANPLAALKAVLRGDVSSLILPPSSS